MICGKGIYEYEHFKPEFAEASVHAVEGIVLLCTACHGKKTRGFLSDKTIKEAKDNPRCKQEGFSWEVFDVGSDHPEILIGELRCRRSKTLIEILGEKVLWIEPSENESDPFRINASIKDKFGHNILKIIETEWQTPAENWDVEIVGSRISIRQSLGGIALVLRSDPPDRLVFERIYLEHRGIILNAVAGKSIEVRTPSGVTFSAQGAECSDCDVVLSISLGGIGVGRGGSTFFSNLMVNHRPSVPRPTPPRVRLRRNEPCYCGSGIKFKRCRGSVTSL